ncbi:MAG: TIGR04141 family sporadically distributed protein [Rhizobacter sp.]|nr:TIGR04141 family sporadically distributed protein [Ferruginibacter sp.]
MSDNSKMQISIRQIDLYRFGNSSFNDVTDVIVQEINKNEENNTSKFSIQKMTEEYPGFDIRIYHATKTNPPRWLGFFNEIIAKDEEILKSYNIYSTFLAFIGFKENIYAISGGTGNMVLDRFSVMNLGTEVLTRLIKKDEKVINSLKDRSFIGNILGQSRIYKDDQRLTDEDQFGKIYNQVKAVLNKEILSKIFKFSKSDLSRKTANCIAHSSFQINKRISFKKLLEIIERIDWLFETRKEPNFTLNNVIHIDKRKLFYQELRTKLELEFKSQIYNKYVKKEELDFDFCHKNYEEFYDANEYVATRGRTNISSTSHRFTFSSILYVVKKDGFMVDDSLEEFIYSFLDIKIETLDNMGEALTVGTLYEHLNGEIMYEGNVYFYLAAEWYRVKESFIDQLNSDCKDSIKQVLSKDLISEPFTEKIEDDYVSKFFGKSNTYVMHKLLYENIELCDLLIHDNNSIHLVHIKQGFNHSVRELASQISMAAKHLIHDRTTNCKLISKLEKKITDLKGNTNSYLGKVGSQSLPSAGLASIFNDIVNVNQIIFCLAFVDKGAQKRDLLNDIEKFESSIAKYSILELKKTLMYYGFGFKIVQLPN